MRVAGTLVLPLVAWIAGNAEAHPGHAREVVSSDRWWHYVLQPEHAMIGGVSLVMLVVFLSVVKRSLAARRHVRLAPLVVRRDV